MSAVRISFKKVTKRATRVFASLVLMMAQIMPFFVFNSGTASAAISDKATVEVKKVLSDPSDPGTFNLSIVGYSSVTNVGNNGTTGPVQVLESFNVTIAESAYTGTALLNYTTEIVCRNGSGAGAVVASASPSTPVARGLTINHSNINKDDVILCVITNTRITAPLTVTKVIDQTLNGGTEVASDFSFTVSGYNNGNPIPFEADGSNTINVPTNLFYTVTEVSNNGYVTTYNNCTSVLVLSIGPTQTCIITNTSKPATLTINKVINDNYGGTSVPEDFSFSINGGASTNFNSSGTNVVSLHAGTYSVAEDSVPGYEVSYSDGCTDLVLGAGDEATCTITNNQLPAVLHVVKKLIQDNGGTDAISSFSFTVNGGSPVNFDSNGEATLNLNPGEYSVLETVAPGYTTSYETCDNLDITNGEEATCTITNDDQPATLTVHKSVINDNGGKLKVKDFNLFVTGDSGTANVDSGISIILNAGSYVVDETDVTGYTGSDWSGNCDKDGNLVAVIGGNYDCYITNDDQPGTLIVHKSVVNDNGGTSNPEDFRFRVNTGPLQYFDNDGENIITVNAGTYTVTEPLSNTYSTSYNGCTFVKIKIGETKHCYITNNDRPPEVTVVKETNPKWDSQDFNFNISVADTGYSQDFTLDGNLFDDGVLNIFNTNNSMQAGWVSINEDEVDGWVNDSITCYVRVGLSLNEISYPFEAEIGKDYLCNVVNTHLGTVKVTKFHDYNENGTWDEGEPSLPDWEMNLTGGECQSVILLRVSIDDEYDNCEASVDESILTDENGVATFDNIYPGEYELNETMQDGWVQSSLYCDNVSDRIKDSWSDDSSTYLTVDAGETVHCYVGNYREPKVEIVKSNNVVGFANRGSQITFTITVKVPTVTASGALKGTMDGLNYLPVTVTDYLTDGFSYLAGSFTASSSVRGDLKASGITADPNYHSPGKWLLTTQSSNVIVPGEIITLTYKAVVGASVPAGIYDTQATVLGYGDNVTVTATATDPDEVKVSVPAVLGTSTVASPTKLSNTGSNQIFALTTGLTTILVVVFSQKKTAQKSSKK